jgi:transcriptional regulator with XRE-family HTH domain
MTAIERLEEYLQKHNISYARVERDAGLNKNYLSKQVSNKGSIGANILESICSALPRLNPAWLLTGHGAQELQNVSTGLAVNPAVADEAATNKFADMARAQLQLIGTAQLPDDEKIIRLQDLTRNLIGYIEDLDGELKFLQNNLKQINAKLK